MLKNEEIIDQKIMDDSREEIANELPQNLLKVIAYGKKYGFNIKEVGVAKFYKGYCPAKLFGVKMYEQCTCSKTKN